MAQMSKECDKAATILAGFLDSGKLPASVLTTAKGVAIFNAFRAGMYFAGTAGTGIVLARLSDGSWSSPSALSVKSGGVGLVYGIDHFECICVLNTEAALEPYKDNKLNVGGRVEGAAGSLGGKFDAGDNPAVLTYTKSRGLYGGVSVDGTVVKEQQKANAEFFGKAVTAAEILEGRVVVPEKSNESAGVAKLTMALSSVDQKALH